MLQKIQHIRSLLDDLEREASLPQASYSPPIPVPLPEPPMPRRSKSRLTIFNYAWHIGHQYELHKLPHDFILSLREDTHPWKYEWRPVQPNVRFVPFEQINFDDIDLAILHFDENVVDKQGIVGSGTWGKDTAFYLHNLPTNIPRILICHGMPPRYRRVTPETHTNQDRFILDGIGFRALHDFVGNNTVVLNSPTAAIEWGFPHQRTIIHGFNPVDYPLGKREKGAISITTDLSHRAYYRGADIYKTITKRVPVDLLGKDDTGTYPTIAPPLLPGTPENALKNFRIYTEFIGLYSVYVHHCRLSPNPRARAEAVLSGLALVSTNFHGESDIFENGTEALLSNDPEELAGMASWLVTHPDEAKRTGERGRAKAQKVWHQDRYLGDWNRLLHETLSTHHMSKTVLT